MKLNNRLKDVGGIMDSFVDPIDLKGIQYWVKLKNLTSQVDIPLHEDISITKFEMSEIYLRIPPKVCAEGHWLWLHIFPANLFQKLKDRSSDQLENFSQVIPVSGKVIAMEKMDSQYYEIQIHLTQYDEEQWKKFLENFEKRQEQIDQIFKKNQA